MPVRAQNRVRVLSRRPTVRERVRSGMEKGRRRLIGLKGKVNFGAEVKGIRRGLGVGMKKVLSPVERVALKVRGCLFGYGRMVEERYGRKVSARDEGEGEGRC